MPPGIKKILRLELTSGPATIVDPEYIKLLDDPPKSVDELKIHRVADDHRVFFQGQFGGFRLYLIVTHTRFSVAQRSVYRISDTHFIAKLRCELQRGQHSEHEVAFRTPILPFSSVTECAYGPTADSFDFRLASGGSERFPCDLTFLTHYGENPPRVPLEVEYVGMTSAPGREAHNRLGDGHNKLQRVLAQQSRRGGGRATSLLLYRPSELDPPDLTFPEVIETIEASLIQHFKPTPLNIEHLDFPKNATKLTRRIVEAGVRQVFVEVEAPENTTLFSKQVSETARHQMLLQIP